MKRFLNWLAPLAALAALWAGAAPVHAQNTVAAQTVSACGTPNNTPKVGNSYPITQDTTGTLCTVGGGGGGGGAVTLAAGAVHAGAYVAGSILSGAAADGWNVTLGTIADAACSTDNGSCTQEALAKRNNQRITSLITALGTPMQTSGGTVGISGTLPAFASTPAFTISGTLPAFAATPTFNCGTGCGGTGSVSNASSLATSSTSLNTIGYQYAFDGTTWRQAAAVLNGSAYAQLVDESTSSQFHTDFTSPIPSGTNLIGKVGIDQTTPGTTNGTVVVAATAGGAASFHAQSAATNNATLVSTGAHTLYMVTVINPTTSMACLHTYDNATSPTVGTTTIKHTFTVSAAASAGINAGGAVVSFPVGEAYASGLTISMTGGASNTCTDADTSSGPLGVDIELSYK